MIYVEEMLAQLKALDETCERLERRMEIEPFPAGLDIEADDLEARIQNIEENLPAEVRLTGWQQKVHFIRLYLRKRQPQGCVDDVSWLRTSIIPKAAEDLNAWGGSLAYFDKELRDSVRGLVRSREFSSAIRQAFVILTERLRAKHGLKPGNDGLELVNQIYGAKSTLTAGMDAAERQSMRDYLAGAYGLLRNKYAHGSPPLDLTELEAALATVNLALKMLRAP